MPDHVLIDGDQAIFHPNFGAATVAVRPGVLLATGPATRALRRLCIRGDERSVFVPGCMYVTPAHPLPGVGTLEILALAADQIAIKTRTGRTPMLLVGSTFLAKYTIQSPAMTPIGSPDGAPLYYGTGVFFTSNHKLRST